MNPDNKIPFVDRIRECYNNAMQWRGGDESDDYEQFDLSKSFEKLLEINRQKQQNKNLSTVNSVTISSTSTSTSSRYKTCNDFEDDSLEIGNQTTQSYDSYKTTNPLPNECASFNSNVSKDTSNSDLTNNNSNNNNNETESELIGIEKLSIQYSVSDDNDDVNIIPVVEPKLDDTLEVVEYIPNESKYVLKPLPTNKMNNSSTSLHQEFNSFGNIEAKSVGRSFCNDIFHESDAAINLKHDQSTNSKDVIDLTNGGDSQSDNDDGDDVDEGLEVVSDENDEGIEVLPADDDYEDDVKVLPNNEVYDSSEFSFDCMKAGENNENENSIESLTIPTDFNDSIERMEFMMKRGEELLKKQIQTQNFNQTKSPIIKTPRKFSDPNLKNTTQSQISSSILKPYNLCDSQKKIPSPFKKPDVAFLTPGVTRKPPSHQIKGKITHLASKPITQSSFSHIKSPIGVYIKNRQMPMVQNVHSTEKKRLEFSSMKQNSTNANNSLDFTILNTKNIIPSKLPVKTYIKANTQLVTDLRDEVIPGGQKIKSLFAPEPKITRHLGHIVENKQQILDNTVVEINNLMDVSIVERPNVQRY